MPQSPGHPVGATQWGERYGFLPHWGANWGPKDLRSGMVRVRPGGVMVYRKVCGYTPAGRRGKGREVEGVVGG